MDFIRNAKSLKSWTQGGFCHQNFSHLPEQSAAGGHHPGLGGRRSAAQEQGLHPGECPGQRQLAAPGQGAAVSCQKGKTQIPWSRNMYFAKQNYFFYLSANLRKEWLGQEYIRMKIRAFGYCPASVVILGYEQDLCACTRAHCNPRCN